MPNIITDHRSDEESRPITSAQIATLCKRCEEASIPQTTGPLRQGGDESTRQAVFIDIPAGREHRELVVRNLDEGEALESIPFEKFRFLAGFVAIWSRDLAVVEAALEAGTRIPTILALERLLGSLDASGSDEEAQGITVASDPNRLPRVSLTIGPPSTEFAVLYQLSRDRLVRRPRRFRTPTLRIEGLEVEHHDTAAEILRKVGDAMLFQVDLKTDLPIVLAREQLRPHRMLSRRRHRETVELTFPEDEYDPEPMSLYWYASSSTGLPLLQFLAYYQVIEFFLPSYSQVEAQRVVRNILKDPSFDAHRDSDITRLLTALRGSGNLRSFGDERSQLRATIHECLEPKELRDFLESDSDAKEFYSKSKALSATRIPLNNPDADLRNEVADRIYDIRCRIVHTKSENLQTEAEPLLPFSKEAQQLGFDIELVRLVARKVLIAGGNRMSF